MPLEEKELKEEKEQVKNKVPFYYINYFNTKSKTATGGVTGSARVYKADSKGKYIPKGKREYFQLKPSILDNTFVRKTKAKSTDRENFGEVLASGFARALMSADDKEKVPEVSLVLDKTDGIDKPTRILVASKYLKNVKGTLNEYAKQCRFKKPEKQKHYHFSDRQIEPAETELTGIVGLKSKEFVGAKESLCKAIALSAVLGDHDVNPGNMIVLKEEKSEKIEVVRIDFGHAFNDLLNAPESFGGKVRLTENRIIDFINRETVAGVSKKQMQSKLWRHYPDLVPSEEIAKALIELGTGADKKIEEVVAEQKNNFRALFDKLKKEDDKEAMWHLVNSLQAVCGNIGIAYEELTKESFMLEANRKENIDFMFDSIFKTYKNFMEENCRAALVAGNMMKLQVMMEKKIKGESVDTKEYTNTLKELDALGMNVSTKLTWLKMSKNEKPFVGDMGEYVKYRMQQQEEKMRVSVDKKSLLSRLKNSFFEKSRTSSEEKLSSMREESRSEKRLSQK